MLIRKQYPLQFQCKKEKQISNWLQFRKKIFQLGTYKHFKFFGTEILDVKTEISTFTFLNWQNRKVPWASVMAWNIKFIINNILFQNIS